MLDSAYLLVSDYLSESVYSLALEYLLTGTFGAAKEYFLIAALITLGLAIRQWRNLPARPNSRQSPLQSPQHQARH